MVATNLNAEQIPDEAVKKLYAMRCGIETSFRDLKYIVGLLHFHSKKAEYIIQEIFAKIIMYNFTELIPSLVVVRKKTKNIAIKQTFLQQYIFAENFTLKIYLRRMLKL